MKKILVAAAIVFAAVASQAASVTWTILNIQGSEDVTVSAGWVVELYSSAVDWSYDAAKSGSITALDSTATVATGTMFKSSSTYGNYAAGDAVSVYAVIYDAANVADAQHYIVSAVADKSIAASGANLTVSFGNMAATTTANLFRNSTWESVPEPTSGLLMLLGMAGLALRRRRA